MRSDSSTAFRSRKNIQFRRDFIHRGEKRRRPIFYAAATCVFIWDRLLPVYEPIIGVWFVEWGSLFIATAIGYSLWHVVVKGYGNSLILKPIDFFRILIYYVKAGFGLNFYPKKRDSGIFSPVGRQNTRGISMEYIHNLIWLCPLLFIAGFIDSVAGGGGLIVLPAYMMCGMPIHYVYGCNKFQCAFGSTVAAWKYFKSGCLDLKITLISAVTSFMCSMLGTRIIFYLKEEQLRTMLMVLLPLTAILVIFMKNAWNYTDTQKPLILPNVLRALFIGMALGLYDSMYGPGGGTIAILLFTFLLKYDIRTASGNAKLTLIVSNYTALLSYIIAGNIFYAVAIPCALCNVLGNYIGAGFAIKNGAKIIRPVMICVVTVLIVKTVLGK